MLHTRSGTTLQEMRPSPLMHGTLHNSHVICNTYALWRGTLVLTGSDKDCRPTCVPLHAEVPATPIPTLS